MPVMNWSEKHFRIVLNRWNRAANGFNLNSANYAEKLLAGKIRHKNLLRCSSGNSNEFFWLRKYEVNEIFASFLTSYNNLVRRILLKYLLWFRL